MIESIKTLEEFNELISSDKLVVIDFTATWCGPCKRIAPEFEKMALENPNCIFRKVDVDDCPDICDQCSIESMPTFHLYKNNRNLSTFSGASIDTLKEEFNSHNK